MEFCDINQIVAASGLHKDTVHRHKRHGYLKDEPTPGVKSLRFRISHVERWLNRYFPTIARDALRKLKGEGALP